MLHLIMNLESPMMAFGSEIIDHHGFIRKFPSSSMLTGMLGNALGWHRWESRKHQLLQDNLIFAARVDRESCYNLQDFQSVKLGKDDTHWTTSGIPETRAGSSATFDSPHLRFRDYHMDARVTIALRMTSHNDLPSLGMLADALEKPKRPLFIGRKPCIPSTSIFVGFIDGSTALTALCAWPAEIPGPVEAFWPDNEGMDDAMPEHRYIVTDQRQWASRLHGGGRIVCEGRVSPAH